MMVRGCSFHGLVFVMKVQFLFIEAFHGATKEVLP